MKKYLLFILISLMFLFCGCEYNDYLTLSPSKINIGFISIKDNDCPTLITEDFISKCIENDRTFINYKLIEQTKLLDTVNSFCLDQNISTIVVDLFNSDLSQINKIIALVEKNNKAVIFYNYNKKIDNNNFSKCFNIYSNYELAGELIGSSVINAYKNNYFIDKNKDYLLQYVFVNDNLNTTASLNNYALSVIENNGLFPDIVTTIDVLNETDAFEKVNAYLSSEKKPDEVVKIPEVFLCYDKNIARGVIEALNQKELLFYKKEIVAESIVPEVISSDISSEIISSEPTFIPETVVNEPIVNYAVTCFGYNEDTSSLINNNSLLSTIIYDTKSTINIILKIAQNISEQNSPTQNISYTMDEHNNINIPYLTVDKSNFSTINWIK